MKVKLSRKMWEEMGRKAEWLDKSKQPAEEVNPTPLMNCMMDISGSPDPKGFALALKDLCVKFKVKMDMVNKTIDV